MLDEPSEGWSPVLVDELGRAISDIAGEGTGVVLVEQHLALIKRTSHRFVVVEKGMTTSSGFTADVEGAELMVLLGLGKGNSNVAAPASAPG